MPGDDEGRALSFDAGHVEIATALMDRHLRAELGVDVDQGHARCLLGAVPAALADPAVDPHRLGERRALTPVPQPPFFGRAGVMVDERGDTRRTGQLVLSLRRLVPVHDGRDSVDVRVGELGGIGRRDDDLRHALHGQPVRELGNAHLADGGLSSRHGDGVVVEDLVGHGDPGRHCGPHGQ